MAPHAETIGPVVFVISPDWTLRTMVRAELREANVEALGMEGVGDMENALARGVAPSMIVADGAELQNPLARKVVEDLARNVAVLVVNSRTEPAPDLPGGEVLWRPVRVQDIVTRILAKLGRKTS